MEKNFFRIQLTCVCDYVLVTLSVTGTFSCSKYIDDFSRVCAVTDEYFDHLIVQTFIEEKKINFSFN